ncbi:MAG: GNAT family N-acetyltransferase [Parcubacteria group bacterium]|jgi:phosphinothricin acetyltransferase
MFNIRPFKEEDTDKVRELLKELTEGPINFEPQLLLNNKAVCCRVIESDGDIIGFGALAIYPVPTRGMVGKLEDIVVSSVYRGGGLGKKLVEELIAVAKKEKLKSLSLTSNPSRIAARNLYASLGFIPAETEAFWIKL